MPALSWSQIQRMAVRCGATVPEELASRLRAVEADAERSALLDDIAYPLKAKPEFSHGAAFFSRFRDLVSTGFWTSKIGIADLKYLGNVANPLWNGCPDECYTHLGVNRA